MLTTRQEYAKAAMASFLIVQSGKLSVSLPTLAQAAFDTADALLNHEVTEKLIKQTGANKK
jgi:hypothetical protein